jgi:hypothetical protein
LQPFQEESEFDPFHGLVRPMPRANRPKFKGTITVAFDGSGNIASDTSVSYAGAAASNTQWAAFAEAWDELLEKYDLAYFKMAEAATFYGEFQPKYDLWGQDREARLNDTLLEFAGLAHRYAMRVGGSAFVVGNTGVSPFNPSDSMASKKKELFQDAILELLRSAPSDYSILLLCDVEKDVEDIYRGWIDGLTRTHSDKVARIMGIAFLDDLFTPSIQFADMVAWVLRKEVERKFFRPEDPVSPLYALLAGGLEATFEPFTLDRQRSGLKLRI